MKSLKGILGLLIVGTLFWGAYRFIFVAKEPIKDEATNTTLKVSNATQDSVLVYLTLGSQDTTFVQNVNGIFGITQSGLVGSFYLHSQDTLSYTSTLKLSGNIGFGSQGINCPNSTWLTGVNIFEFNLNEAQESLDISAMGGVNSIMGVDLIGGANWGVTGNLDVRHCQNDTMYKNTSHIGVYPFKCTDCTDTLGSASCTQIAETPNKTAICNPTRAKGERGGVVLLTFKGYTNWQICK